MKNTTLQNKGFTLIELMVTITILGITAAIVVPNLNSFMTNLRLKSSARSLYADLNETKMLAMKTLIPHTLLLGGTSGTQQGWTMFKDTDLSGTMNGTETELANLTLENGITILPADLGTAISFDRRGLITPNSIGSGIGTYTLESLEFTKQKALTVSPTGYMTID